MKIGGHGVNMKPILKIPRYIFFKLYIWSIGLWGKNREPHINAVFLFAIFLSINIMDALLMLRNHFGISITHIPKIVGPILVFSISIIIYFVYSYKDKYLKIKKEFENESSKQKLAGSIMVVCYLIISFLLLYFI